MALLVPRWRVILKSAPCPPDSAKRSRIEHFTIFCIAYAAFAVVDLIATCGIVSATCEIRGLHLCRNRTCKTSVNRRLSNNMSGLLVPLPVGHASALLQPELNRKAQMPCLLRTRRCIRQTAASWRVTAAAPATEAAPNKARPGEKKGEAWSNGHSGLLLPALGMSRTGAEPAISFVGIMQGLLRKCDLLR